MPLIYLVLLQFEFHAKMGKEGANGVNGHITLHVWIFRCKWGKSTQFISRFIVFKVFFLADHKSFIKSQQDYNRAQSPPRDAEGIYLATLAQVLATMASLHTHVLPRYLPCVQRKIL